MLLLGHPGAKPTVPKLQLQPGQVHTTHTLQYRILIDWSLIDGQKVHWLSDGEHIDILIYWFLVVDWSIRLKLDQQGHITTYYSLIDFIRWKIDKYCWWIYYLPLIVSMIDCFKDCLIDCLINCFKDCLIDCFNDSLIDCFNDSLIDCLIDCFNDSLIDCFNDSLIDCFNDSLIDCFNHSMIV